MNKIMVVDDEVIIAKQLGERLEDMGYNVTGKAYSGAEAIEMAGMNRPDLILMDIVMPGELDGIETARIIKDKLDIPIIFITAYTNHLYITRAKNVEPFGYIVKPFHDSEIEAAIEIALFKKAHIELEKKVKERTAELVKSNEELQAEINNRRRIEEEFIRSECLAVTGMLAASVSHEISSPLQAIIVLMSFLKKKTGEDKEMLEIVDKLKNGINIIRDTVKRLSDLSRPGREKKQPTDINEVIENTAALMKSYLKKNKVKVNLNLSSRIPDIIASPGQLWQVFLNLINNSVEAMSVYAKPEGRCKRGIVKGGEITIDSHFRKDKIVIHVSDTGLGIPEKDLEHVFDPFYTSRKKSEIRIGLSICYRIIEDHNGTITAENKPDGGAIFTIVLPERCI